MDIFDNLNKAEPEHFILVVLCFLSMFSPGMLGVVIYYPSAFMEMRTIKLVFLSFALSVPVVIPQIVGVGVLLSISDKFTTEQKFKMVPIVGTMSGAALSMIGAYILLTLAYLLNLDVKAFVLIVSLILALASFWWVREIRKILKKNEENT